MARASLGGGDARGAKQTPPADRTSGPVGTSSAENRTGARQKIGHIDKKSITLWTIIKFDRTIKKLDACFDHRPARPFFITRTAGRGGDTSPLSINSHDTYRNTKFAGYVYHSDFSPLCKFDGPGLILRGVFKSKIYKIRSVPFKSIFLITSYLKQIQHK